MNEVGLNAKWLQADMTTAKTQQFAKDVLNHMRTRLSDYQELYGDLYNLEATPAESTAFRLAKHDLKYYPDIITAGCEKNQTPYYTNSSHLPVGYTQDIFEALDMQDELHTLYTSGTVFHAFLGEKLPDWKSCADLVRKIASNYRLPYYSISPIYSICKNHGYIAGEAFTCPECGEEAEVYSRITGYYRPVKNWNDGKAQEYKDRKVYDIANSTEPHNTPVAEACACDEVKVADEDKIILFATRTCPNCKMAVQFLNKAGIAFEEIFADENADMANKFEIRQAPTLVVIKGGVAEKIVNLSNIKGFIENYNK
jgi:ribonucleoside-triphosphate reductase